MKNKILILMSTVLVAFATTSCKKDPLATESAKSESFLMYALPSVISNSVVLHTFDPINDQYSYSEDLTFFFATNAEQTRYVEYNLAAAPSKDQPIKMTVKAVGIENFGNGEYNVKQVQDKGNLIWLWDDAQQTGFILQYK